jgi:hypothetical protein
LEDLLLKNVFMLKTAKPFVGNANATVAEQQLLEDAT